MRGTCCTLASHGVQSRRRRPLSSLRFRQASFDAMEGNEIVCSIMALLSRLRPLVGGCLAEVCGFDPVLSRFHCCCCRPVTKLTGASAASRVSGPLIRHPSARDFGVTGSGALSRGQRPGRRHRDPSRPRPAQLLPALPGRVAPPQHDKFPGNNLQAQAPWDGRATAGD